MPAKERNITLEKGADYAVSGRVSDDNKNPIDLSGSTFYGSVFDFCGGTKKADFVYSISLGSDGYYSYTRSMARAIIDGIDITEGYWEQYEVNAANKSTKYMFGTVCIKCGSIEIPA